MKIKTLLLISSFLVSGSVFAGLDDPFSDPAMNAGNNPPKPNAEAGVVGVGQPYDCCIKNTANVVRIGDTKTNYGKGPGENPQHFEGSAADAPKPGN